MGYLVHSVELFQVCTAQESAPVQVVSVFPSVSVFFFLLHELGGGTASEITHPLFIIQVDDLSEVGIGFQVPYTQTRKLSSATVKLSKKPDLLASGYFHFPLMKSQLSDDFVQQQTNHPVSSRLHKRADVRHVA